MFAALVRYGMTWLMLLDREDAQVRRNSIAGRGCALSLGEDG
jgi:hypothetical protein